MRRGGALTRRGRCGRRGSTGKVRPRGAGHQDAGTALGGCTCAARSFRRQPLILHGRAGHARPLHLLQKQAALSDSLSSDLIFSPSCRQPCTDRRSSCRRQVTLLGVFLTQSAAPSSPLTTTLPGSLAARSSLLTLPSSFLAAAHDGQQHDLIGGVQYLANSVHQHLGAAVGKRLMHRDHTVIAHLLSRGQRGGQLGGMVGVVIPQ